MNRMQNPKFTIFRSAHNNQYYFRLRSGNGEVILSSEGYLSKQGCLTGIKSVKLHSPYDIWYNRKESPSGYSFQLKSANHEVIGRSEVYTTRIAREVGISAVKATAPAASIEDLT